MLVMTSVPTDSSSSKPARKPRVPWTPQEDALLRHHWPISPSDEIKQLFPQRAWNLVYMHAWQLGLERPKDLHGNTWTAADLAYLDASYGKVPHEEMAIRLGRNEHAITEYARRRGLKMVYDETGKSVNKADHPTLVPLMGDDPQAHYWMGYLMADGYMHHGLGQVVLVSAEADACHMETFARFLKSKTHRYEAPSPWTGLMTPHYRVSVAETITAKKLVTKYDWKPQKTYNPPSTIVLDQALLTADAFLAFLVGFIDGDGHVTETQGARIENHATWLPFHQWICDRLQQLGFETTPAKLNARGYSGVFLRRACVNHIKQFINRINLTVLTRKWDQVIIPL